MLLYVKGSGWDLETIEAAGFSPVCLEHLLRLARLKSLSDPQMVNELRTHYDTRRGADAVGRGDSARVPAVQIRGPYPRRRRHYGHQYRWWTQTHQGDLRRLGGHRSLRHAGIRLARLCAERFAADAGPQTRGMVLMNHGIFSFGKTAKESYERMIELVSRAEEYLEKRKAWHLPAPEGKATGAGTQSDIAVLRREISETAGFPVILAVHADPASLAFANRKDIGKISQRGPATPDHVIRTKRVPLVGRDVPAYVKSTNSTSPSMRQRRKHR